MIAAILMGGPDDRVQCEVFPRDGLTYVPFFGPILPWSDHIGPGQLVYAETNRVIDGRRVFEYVKASPCFPAIRRDTRAAVMHHG